MRQMPLLSPLLTQYYISCVFPYFPPPMAKKIAGGGGGGGPLFGEMPVCVCVCVWIVFYPPSSPEIFTPLRSAIAPNQTQELSNGPPQKISLPRSPPFRKSLKFIFSLPPLHRSLFRSVIKSPFLPISAWKIENFRAVGTHTLFPEKRETISAFTTHDAARRGKNKSPSSCLLCTCSQHIIEYAHPVVSSSRCRGFDA